MPAQTQRMPGGADSGALDSPARDCMLKNPQRRPEMKMMRIKLSNAYVTVPCPAGESMLT